MTGSGHAEHRRLGALRAQEVRRLDAAAAEAGLPLEVLMETAGWQLARTAWRLLGRAPGPVLVCAGRGNNGGDALVMARQLAGWGCAVTVLLVGAPHPGPLVTEQRRRLRASAPSATLIEVDDAAPLAVGAPLAARLAEARLVVDGLLGSGLRGAPRDLDAAVIAALRHPRILSVDVPSGLDVDSGTAAGACVSAHTTCTLTAMKRGLWGARARAHTGALLVADIGIPAVAWARAGLEQPSAVRGGALLRVAAVLD
ncbi:MAG: NAD(P)H-hydrate epimerase [Candidatus Dormibacteria bacterium]